MPIPILLVGDAPTGHSGLGRILKDVALRIHAHMGDEFDVATLGYGAPPSKSLPFMQYQATKVNDWVLEDLPYAWNDHSPTGEGIIFFLWDISRLLWFAYPDQCQNPMIQQWVGGLKAKTWIYPAIDGAGPKGRLPSVLAEALKGFDRVLNYTEFSAKITGYPDVCHHGIDTDVFYPRPDARKWVDKRFSLELDSTEVLIGIVATNQPRKDWGLAFAALALLNERGIKARVWLHTDTLTRHWNLQQMFVDFGLQPNISVFLTPYGIPDDDLALMYSACTLTLGIGPEGAGYPILESMACGVPCITGRYGGQTDYVPKEYMVVPKAYRYEGIFAVQRPVYDPVEFYWLLAAYLGKGERRMLNYQFPKAEPAWAWEEVWKDWDKWLREGL